jgi:hypothetical protein
MNEGKIDNGGEHTPREQSGYRGMHNGTVRGKGFEQSRRNRKSHAERRAQHAAKSK